VTVVYGMPSLQTMELRIDSKSMVLSEVK